MSSGEQTSITNRRLDSPLRRCGKGLKSLFKNLASFRWCAPTTAVHHCRTFRCTTVRLPSHICRSKCWSTGSFKHASLATCHTPKNRQPWNIIGNTAIGGFAHIPFDILAEPLSAHCTSHLAWINLRHAAISLPAYSLCSIHRSSLLWRCCYQTHSGGSRAPRRFSGPCDQYLDSR